MLLALYLNHKHLAPYPINSRLWLYRQATGPTVSTYDTPTLAYGYAYGFDALGGYGYGTERREAAGYEY